MPDPAGQYAGMIDVYAVAGPINVNKYSNVTGGTALDPDRMQRAFDDTDSKIAAYFKRAGIDPAMIDPAFTPLIREASALLAVAWLYRTRGNTDAPSVDSNQENSDYYSRLGGWTKKANCNLIDVTMTRRTSIDQVFGNDNQPV